MEAIDRYLQRLAEPGVRDDLRRMYRIEEGDVSREVATEEQVAEVERALGVPLPPSYRKLVTTVSPYDGGYEVSWVDDLHGFGAPIVLANRGADSNRFPPFLIGVIDCDDGDAFCFDTRHPDKRGEYPIVRFDHDVHGGDTADWTEFETCARDLGEFLLSSLGGEAATEAERSAPRIWELPASTVIRKGRSFARRRTRSASRYVGSRFAALRSRLGAPKPPPSRKEDREWLWKKMSPLLVAVDTNDLQKATELLSQGGDPDEVSHSSTPLKWALTENYREMVSLLLQFGADRRVIRSGESYFELAFRKDPALGAWFLAQFPDATLLEAAEAGTMDHVRRLVDAGADVNMVGDDPRRRSPLVAAVRREHQEMVTFLLDRGADLASRGSGLSIVFAAVAASSELTELVLRRGADPNAIDETGRTPLFQVARTAWIDVLETLIRGGADVNFRDPEGATPLHAAACNTDPQALAIRMLVAHGAEINAQDHRGSTPLHVAMDATHADAAGALLDLGADPLIRDREGRTPAELVRESVRLFPGIPEVVRRMARTS